MHQIIDEHKANKYDCCQLSKKCTGKSCMAWCCIIDSFLTPDGRTDSSRGKIDSGRGYCGLIER